MYVRMYVGSMLQAFSKVNRLNNEICMDIHIYV